MNNEILIEIAKEILTTRGIGFDEIVSSTIYNHGTLYITYTNVKLVEKHNAEIQKKYIDKLVNANWFGRLFITKPETASDLNKYYYKDDNEFSLRVECSELILMLFEKLKDYEHK